jgi:capsular exopolysaccharide synthesis family protein
VELVQFARVLRRWAWLIVLFAAIATVTAAVVSYELPESYQAKVVALVNPKQVLLPATNSNVSLSSDQLVATYARLLNATAVQQKLIADGVPRSTGELAGEITAKTDPSTSVVDITIRDRDPQVTQLIATDIIPAFNASLLNLQEKVAAPGSTTPRLDALVPWDIPASAPTTPESPKPLLNMLFALAAGLAIGVGFAFLLEHLDNTVKTEQDVRTRLDMGLLGSVVNRVIKPRVKKKQPEDVALVTMTHPNEPVAEAYRAIRTNLMFNSVERKLQSIVVTSAIPGEGKTSTACNLAVTMAQAGNRVVLVDSDFRRPSLHKIFHKPSVGLGNLFLGNRPEEELIVPTRVQNLWLVCSGPTPPNPSELLGSERMSSVIRGLREQADVVIFDTPPIGAVTDAVVLAAQCDGVIMVVERGRTDVASIRSAADKLQGVHANILGVVLNKVRAADSESMAYYRYYSAPTSSNGKSNATPPTPTRAPVRPVVAEPIPPAAPPPVIAEELADEEELLAEPTAPRVQSAGGG